MLTISRVISPRTHASSFDAISSMCQLCKNATFGLSSRKARSANECISRRRKVRYSAVVSFIAVLLGCRFICFVVFSETLQNAFHHSFVEVAEVEVVGSLHVLLGFSV